MVEEEAPFLAGHGRQGLDLSPVKIVKVSYSIIYGHSLICVNLFCKRWIMPIIVKIIS